MDWISHDPDISQDIEAKGLEACSQPGHSAAVESETSVQCDVHAVEVTGPCCSSSSPYEQSRKGKETSFSGDGSSKSPKLVPDLVSPDSGAMKDNGGPVEGRTSVDFPEKFVAAHGGINTQLENIKAAEIEETKLPNIGVADIVEMKASSPANKEVSPTVLPKVDSGEVANHGLQSKTDVDQMASSRFPRSCTSQVKRRSLSPGVNYDDGNKRPAIICEYFTKGWCIKGSSCRFLHKREHVDNARQQAEGDILSTKSELRADEGSGDKADSTKLPLFNQLDVVGGNGDHLLPSSAGKNILQDAESLKRNPDDAKDKCETLEKEVSSSLFCAETEKSPFCKDTSRSFSGHGGLEADIFKDKHSSKDYSLGGDGVALHSSSFPGYVSLSREVGVASGSHLNSRFSSYSLAQESADMRRHYTSSSYSSLKLGVFGAHYTLRSDREDGADGNDSRDALTSSKYKTKFIPYNWEPSVPFRPSIFIPSLGASSSDIPYDPIRDSLEQPDLGPASFQNSSYNHSSTVPDLPCISERNSLESHKKLQSDTRENNYYGQCKDVPMVEAESAATSASDVQNKNAMLEDEDPVVPASVKDILKASRSIADGNFKLQSDWVMEKEVGVQKSREINELDEEESKAIKYFRAALIDFVKELMKPIWHEGRLSKDVYKVIVQKAEDKILSSLQPNQVPNTSETIKQYLSASRPKILKLIQAYVDKYGKF